MYVILMQVCKRYTRAYLHTLVTKEAMGSQLVSYHNVAYMMQVSGRFLIGSLQTCLFFSSCLLRQCVVTFHLAAEDYAEVFSGMLN